DRVRSEQRETADRIDNIRQWLMMAVVFFGIGMIVAGGLATWRVEQILRDSMSRQGKRTEAIVGGMSDGVMPVDGEGRTVYVNPAAQRLLGKSTIGVPIFRHSDIYNFRDAHGRLLDPGELPAAQALSTGRAVREMTVVIGRDDARVSVSMSATPLQEDGKITGVLVMFRDITERRALEEQMQLQAERAQIIADAGAFFSSNIDPAWVTQAIAERVALAIENAKLYTEQVEARRKVEDLSRLKDEFLSIASHELRTPVTSIKGYTQLAKMLIKEGDLNTSEDYLDIALDQIDRMSRLILELLDVSRIETGRLEIRRDQISWSQFVRDVVHRHHTAVSDRRFHVSVPSANKVVTGDRDRLEQVV